MPDIAAPDPARLLPESPEPYVAEAGSERTRIDAIEGVPMSAPVELRQCIVTPSMSMVEVRWSKGASSRPHVHADHDSVVYVVSGRLRVTIAGEAVTAGPGDSLASPPGVEHAIEALEDSVSIEVKSPPVRTW